MKRGVLSASIFLIGLMIGAWLLGDGVATGVAQEKKFRGMLPPGWRALELSDAQRESIYAAQEKYRTQIKDLEEQIVGLKKKERTEMLAVLTPQQKEKLVELLLGGADKDDTSAKGGKTKGE
jgi:Spy/CpxP family protein refolding chaperone